MNERTELVLARVLAAYDGDYDAFLALGGRPVEADLAVDLARHDLEASRAMAPQQVRAAVDELVRRTLDGDDEA